MHRFRVYCLLFGMLLLLAACSKGDGQEKVFRIGIINLNKNLTDTVKEFKNSMLLLGYEEGRNVTYMDAGVLSNASEARQSAEGMVHSEVDLIYTITTPATKAALKATKGTNIPVVFGPVHSPVKSGLVKSLTQPGGNVTGVRVKGSTPKLVEWLLQLKPEVRHIYVPYHKGNSPSEENLKDLTDVAAILNLHVTAVPVSSPEELRAALASIPPDIDALWLTHSFMLVNHLDQYLAASLRYKIPSLAPVAQTKGLMLSYAADTQKIGGQVARLVDRIFRGADPSQLPVETADFYLGINLGTATAIGLNVPDSLLNMADTVLR